ncbi:hypothetical protein Godav_020793, partial [Gossypium davidsonii]|nr:hypothetical protein [Gossypium davidsonii]MBA0671895.1 hypothetical protein [Gossypium klotzschianum]
KNFAGFDLGTSGHEKKGRRIHFEYLRSLQDEDVEWRAPWMIPNEILYQCGEFD